MIAAMKMIFASLLLLSLSACAFAQSVDPDFFPILPWELGAEKRKLLSEDGDGIESLRDCWFTTAAFVTPDVLLMCEHAGLRALAYLPEHKVDSRKMADEQSS